MLICGNNLHHVPYEKTGNNLFFAWAVRDGDVIDSVVEVNINIDPNTLNLKSKGKWITCYITPPEGYGPEDINVVSVLMDDVFSVEKSDIQGGVLMVKFSRADAIAYIEATLEENATDPPVEVSLTVIGSMTDELAFTGSDTITAIKPEKKKK